MRAGKDPVVISFQQADIIATIAAQLRAADIVACTTAWAHGNDVRETDSVDVNVDEAFRIYDAVIARLRKNKGVTRG